MSLGVRALNKTRLKVASYKLINIAHSFQTENTEMNIKWQTEGKALPQRFVVKMYLRKTPLCFINYF